MYPSEMTAPPEIKTKAEPPAVANISERMAMEAWDALRKDGDPEAAILPPETKQTLTNFAREIRNGTIEQVTRAIERFYTKSTITAVESLRGLKE